MDSSEHLAANPAVKLNPTLMDSPLQLGSHEGVLQGQFSGAYAASNGTVVFHAPKAATVEATVTDGHFRVAQPKPGFYWLILRTNVSLAQFGPVEIE